MRRRPLGDAQVGAIGLGAMPLSIPGRPDEEQAMATIHAALDAGVTLIDTADAYSLSADDFGHNEQIVARALSTYGGDTSEVIVATKGGHTRGDDASYNANGRPEYLKRAAQDSARRLGVDAVGLWQFHRPDPDVPYEESLGALRELLDAGTIRMAGISNANIEQIDLARRIVGDGFVAVQNEFSPRFRSSEGELRHCAEHGLAFLPWSPFGGMSRADALGGPFAKVGEARGVSAHQVCLAWMLALAPNVIPIPGSSRPATIRDSAAAAELQLTDDELATLSI